MRDEEHAQVARIVRRAAHKGEEAITARRPSAALALLREARTLIDVAISKLESDKMAAVPK